MLDTGEGFSLEEAEIVAGDLRPGGLFYLTPIGEGELASWAESALPNEQIVYFVGNLHVIRETDAKADRLASYARRLYENGAVTLVQQRIAEHVALYIARRRPTVH